MGGCKDIAEQFLELGQVDSNLLLPKTGDSPLRLASKYGRNHVIELLLSRGADWNLANAEGLTPLHVIGDRGHKSLAEIFFKRNDDKNQSLKIDARDKDGNTPLHMALLKGELETAELLLRRGASPNLANGQGSTPLHIICRQGNADVLTEMYFTINDEKNQLVLVDAKDNRGRTPLQSAVENCLPNVVDMLLDRGADPSNFVIPTEIDNNYYIDSKFKQVSS